MSLSIPDEGAPCNFDKRRDLSARRSLPRLFVGPYVVRGNYCRPSPASERKRKRGACSHTNVRDFKRESTLSASRQRHRVYRQIVSPRYNNRAKTALPFSPSPHPIAAALILFLSLSLFPSIPLSPRNIPTVQPHTRRINAPTGLPIVNARNVHTHTNTHVDRAASQCPNIPQSKTARRLFTWLLRAAFPLYNRPLVPWIRLLRFLLSTMTVPSRDIRIVVALLFTDEIRVVDRS